MNKPFSVSFCLLIILSTSLSAQTVLIKGKVTDEKTSKGIAGVHVYTAQKNRRGSISNTDGKFALRVSLGSTISFSHIGYQTITKKVDEQVDYLHVVLSPAVQKLQEVIVTAEELTALDIVKNAIDKLDENHNAVPAFFDFYSRSVNFELDSTLNTIEEYTGQLMEAKSHGTRFYFDQVRIGAFSEKAKEELRGFRMIELQKVGEDNIFELREDYIRKNRLKRYSYKIIEEIMLFDRPCYVIEFSTDRNTYYKRGRLFIDMESLAFVRKTLEKKDGTIAHDVTFMKIGDKWFLKKAVDVHRSYAGYITSRITLYNYLSEESRQPTENFKNLNTSGLVEEYITDKFDEDYWKNKNYIPLPDWVMRQIK